MNRHERRAASARRKKAGGLVGILTVEVWANGDGLHDAKAVDEKAIERLRAAADKALSKLAKSAAPGRSTEAERQVGRSTEAERQVGEGLPEPRR